MIAESIPHIVWTASPDGATEYLNRRGTEYTGQPPEVNYEWGWVTLVHPDDAERARLAWEQATATETPCEFEYRLRRFDGEFRWHLARALPVRGADGTVAKWIGTATDIQEQKDFEEQLRQSERGAAETLTLLESLVSSAPIGFVFVDRDLRIVRSNDGLAEFMGVPVDQQLGHTISEVVPNLWPQLEPLYQRVLRLGEPVLNVEVSGPTPKDPGRVHYGLATFYPVRLAGEVIGVGVAVIGITKRKRAEEGRISLAHAAGDAVAAAVEARDPYTAGHQRRVSVISCAVATEVGLEPDAVDGIRLAATIHDIGKIAIPVEILARQGDLDPLEFQLVQTHCRAGSKIVAGINFPWPVADMILQHHERIDGSGYPDGLRGEEITIGARIIAVADTVEAMASRRPYRAAQGLNLALREIEQGRGTKFDATVVDACLRLFHEGRLKLDTSG